MIEVLLEKYLINQSNSRDVFMELHRMEMFLRKVISKAKLEMKEEDDFLAPEEEW